MDIKTRELLENQVCSFEFDLTDKKTVAAAASALTILGASPVLAQTTGSTPDVSSVSGMVTAIGTIAATIATVVVGAMAIRMAIKIVNRVAVKG